MSYPTNAPPRLTEQLAAELRARAAEFGLVVTGRCAYCGRPVWDRTSLAEQAGPVCRRRHTKNDPGASNPGRERTEAVETIPTT